jgi:hypothetical protein
MMRDIMKHRKDDQKNGWEKHRYAKALALVRAKKEIPDCDARTNKTCQKEMNNFGKSVSRYNLILSHYSSTDLNFCGQKYG